MSNSRPTSEVQLAEQQQDRQVPDTVRRTFKRQYSGQLLEWLRDVQLVKADKGVTDTAVADYPIGLVGLSQSGTEAHNLRTLDFTDIIFETFE